ncbi:MAG: hypothetical protein WBG20_04815, partial [Candidatus Deferrimicrobiaceae bacterium]
MKRRRGARRKGEAGRRRRWWPLMFCAFLAGLLTVGVAVLMPGGENRNGKSASLKGLSAPTVGPGESAQAVSPPPRDSLPV